MRSVLGRLIYPLFVYYLIQLIVYYALAALLQNADSMNLTLQFAANLLVIPYLVHLYKKQPIYWWIHEPWEWKKQDRILTLLVCFCAGIALSLALNGLLGMTDLVSQSASYEKVAETFYTGRAVFEVLALGVVTPIAEELMYRGIMFGNLRKYFDIKVAYIVSAVLFGIVHGNLVQFIYACIFGFALCYVADECDTVLAAIVMHMGANLISVINQEILGWSLNILECAIFMVASIAGIMYIRNRAISVKK